MLLGRAEGKVPFGKLGCRGRAGAAGRPQPAEPGAGGRVCAVPEQHARVPQARARAGRALPAASMTLACALCDYGVSSGVCHRRELPRPGPCQVAVGSTVPSACTGRRARHAAMSGHCLGAEPLAAGSRQPCSPSGSVLCRSWRASVDWSMYEVQRCAASHVRSVQVRTAWVANWPRAAICSCLAPGARPSAGNSRGLNCMVFVGWQGAWSL